MKPLPAMLALALVLLVCEASVAQVGPVEGLTKKGDLAMREGRFADALEAYSDAHELIKAHGPRPDVSAALSRIGDALLACGRHEEGLRHKSEALNAVKTFYAAEGHPNHRAVAEVHVDVAVAHMSCGKFHEAREHLVSALRISATNGTETSLSTAAARYRLGLCLVGMKLHREAAQMFTLAVKRWETSTNRAELAAGRESLASCFLAMGETELAHQQLVLLEKQIRDERGVVAPAIELRCAELLSRTFAALGEPEAAATRSKWAARLRASAKGAADARTLKEWAASASSTYGVALLLAEGLGDRPLGSEVTGEDFDATLSSLAVAAGVRVLRLSDGVIALEDDWRKAIERELAETMTLRGIGLSLTRMARSFSRRIPIVVDPAVVGRWGRKDEPTFSIASADGMMTRELLDVMTARAGVTWDVRWGVVYCAAKDSLPLPARDASAPLSSASWKIGQSLVSLRRNWGLADAAAAARLTLKLDDTVRERVEATRVAQALPNVRLVHAVEILLRPLGLEFEITGTHIRVFDGAK